jgi:hypothetical protein
MNGDMANLPLVKNSRPCSSINQALPKQLITIPASRNLKPATWNFIAPDF